MQTCSGFRLSKRGSCSRQSIVRKHYDHYTHPQDAARVVRYLAATDTVDWAVAGKL